MHGKIFMCLCRQAVFSKVCAISYMNNLNEFQDICRIFARVEARKDEQKDKPTICTALFIFIGKY